MRTRVVPRVVGTLAVFVAAGAAEAVDLFQITATGGGNTVVVGGSSIIDLVDNAVNTQGAFAPFQNADTSFNLNWGGVGNAVTVTKNAANTGGTLRFNASNSPTFVFSAANQDDLENQLEDFFRGTGTDANGLRAGDAIRDFLEAINAQSKVAVSDGNPNATTARMANYAYDRYGFYNEDTAMYVVKDGAIDGSGLQFRLGANAQAFEAGDFSGSSVDLFTSLDWNFSKYVGTSLGSFVSWNTVEDADVFHLGLNFGVPIRPVLPTEKVPLTWQITPSFTVAGSASEDAGAGGLIYSGAVTSALKWNINEKWALIMSNQWGFYEGQKLTFSDFEIDPGVSQNILKNGLQARYGFSESFFAYAGASYTNFLDDAAVEGYLTPAAGIGWRRPGGSVITVGFSGDFGDDYTSYGGRLALNWAF